MRSVKRFVGSLVVMGSVISGGVADAATYHASTSGSDGRSCAQAQSTSTPKRTLNNALACVRAGDTLYLRGGVYDEGLWVNVWDGSANGLSGTSWSNKVRIAAYPGDPSVWLRPSSNRTGAGGTGRVLWLDANVGYVEFDGINLDGSNLSEGVIAVSTVNGFNPHHIRIQNAEVIAGQVSTGAAIVLGGHTSIGATGSNELLNLTIHGGGVPGLCGWQCNSYGIYVAGPNNLIDGCDIYDTSGGGVHIYNSTGDAPNNNIVRNNRIHDLTRTGILGQSWGIIDTGANNQLYNNVIYGINISNLNYWNAAISVYGAYNSQVYNNTLYGNTGWGVMVTPGTPGAIIRNNISYGNSLGSLLNYGSGTWQGDNLFTDPRFVNAGGADFRLRSDSPAIDRGAAIGSVQYDQAGVPRPQGSGYDIGAYEFGGSAPGPSPAPSPDPDPAPGASPSGTTIPGAATIVDNSLAVWTLTPGLEIMRNGSQAAGGYGSKILWYGGTIYVVGDDYNWWRWVGNTWAYYSSAPPN